MPEFTASIPHRMTREEAKRQIHEQIDVLRRQPSFVLVGLHEVWLGDRMDFTARAAGQSISGHLIVDDQAVQVTVLLPWMLGLLAGSIRRRLEHDVHRLLSPPSENAVPDS
jgi:hypothetical protein